MRTEEEIRARLKEHKEWLDEWEDSGASEVGQEYGALTALEWVLGAEEPGQCPATIFVESMGNLRLDCRLPVGHELTHIDSTTNARWVP